MSDDLKSGRLAAYIQRLVGACPKFDIAVWLGGARANGRTHPHADYDLFLVGGHDLLKALASRLDLDDPRYDVLVVVDANTACAPWPKNAGEEPGVIHGLRWVVMTDDLAEYDGNAWLSADEGVMTRRERAIRIRL